LPRTVQETRDHQQGRGQHPDRCDPHDGAEQVAVPAAGDAVQEEVEGAHGEICDTEGHPVTAERARSCERHDQHRHHRAEHSEPDGAFLSVQGVRQPGVRRPSPPEGAQQKEAPEEAVPRGAVREEARHLRDCEDENEIEEQLQARDPVLVLGPWILHT
jgi:hypothetical protein